jgi:SCY1-like protein 1
MLLFSLYNPNSPLPNLSSQPSPSMAGGVPKALFPLWKRMVNPNPRTRLPTTSFVAEATATGFWSQNPLANLVDGLDGFELRSEGEKLSLLQTIKDQSSSMPQPFLLYKVLPSLLHSLSLPTAPSSAMLPLVLELGKLVPDKEYGKLVLDPVVKLYTSPDRGTRMALLDGLPEYSEKMDQRTVQERVWPHLVSPIERVKRETLLIPDYRFRRLRARHSRGDRKSNLPLGTQAQRPDPQQRSP